jgi:hypothetical protein
MNRRFVAVVGVSAIALGAGVALAASQTSSISSACVNDVNGLMRASETCRDGEHLVAIGSGSNVAVTQNGSFTVAANASGGAKTLPLTGATLSGRCETFTSPFGGDGATARVLVEAPAGKTMDLFPAFDGPSSVSSKLLPPAGSLIPGMGPSSGSPVTAIFTVNGSTATLAIGGTVDGTTKACTFLWQAVEVPY